MTQSEFRLTLPEVQIIRSEVQVILPAVGLTLPAVQVTRSEVDVTLPGWCPNSM